MKPRCFITLPAAVVVVVVVVTIITTTTITTTTAMDIRFECRERRGKITWKSVNNFGVHLLAAMVEEGNTLVGPLSIWNALSLAYIGARAKTCRQFRVVLGASRKQLVIKFLKLVEAENEKTEIHTQINECKLYVREDLKIRKIAANLLGNRMSHLNFENPNAAVLLSEIVRNNTNGHITSVVTQDQLSKASMFIQASGHTTMTFEPNGMTPCHAPFNDFTDNRIMDVPMTCVKKKVQIGKFPDMKATVVCIPQGRDRLLYVVLPENKGKDEFIGVVNSLVTKSFNDFRPLLKEQDMEVFIPRFEISAQYSDIFKRDLTLMGGAYMFNQSNFYYYMNNMHIGRIQHQITVHMHNTATSTATATGIVLKPRCQDSQSGTKKSNSRSVTVSLDKKRKSEKACQALKNNDCSGDNCIAFNRPFVFALMDEKNRLLWEIGAFVDPKK